MITTRYIASDGSTFDSLREAEEYDRLLETIGRFCAFVGVKEGRPTERAKVLILEWDQFLRSEPAQEDDK